MGQIHPSRTVGFPAQSGRIEMSQPLGRSYKERHSGLGCGFCIGVHCADACDEENQKYVLHKMFVLMLRSVDLCLDCVALFMQLLQALPFFLEIQE